MWTLLIVMICLVWVNTLQASLLTAAANVVLVIILILILLILAMKPRIRNQPDLTPLKNWFYAHRGYYPKDQSIPENSLSAFHRAVENAFGIELDVQLTKDGLLAVFHDEDLKRMCGIDTKVSELNSEQLQEYRLKGTKEYIPLFPQVLQVVDGKIPMVIEIKPYGANISELCARLCKELEEYSGVYCIESFDPRVLRWFKKNRPSVVRGQLAMGTHRYGKEKLFGFFISNCLTNFITKPDFIAYCYEDRNTIGFRLCKRLYGVQEFSWTVRTPEVARELQKSGALLIFEYFDPRRK
jgi:glycerophosphoryl diester phosphodiesterase